MARGITEATISPALKLPKNKTKMNNTINAPSRRFVFYGVDCVIDHFRSVEERFYFYTFRKCRSNLFYPILYILMTSLLFAPLTIMTTARPLHPDHYMFAAPYRVAWPSTTSATSFNKSSVPFNDFWEYLRYLLLILPSFSTNKKLR